MSGLPDGLHARLLVEADWEPWRDLRLRALEDSPEAFGSTLERERGFTEQDWRTRTGGDGPAVLVLSGDQPVAMGGGFRDLPGWLHVVAMWTEPAWRGQGAGELVIETLSTWAHEQRLRLHLDVTVGNDGARRFYERCGFVATGETRPLRDGSPYSVERMVLAEPATGA